MSENKMAIKSLKAIEVKIITMISNYHIIKYNIGSNQ